MTKKSVISVETVQYLTIEVRYGSLSVLTKSRFKSSVNEFQRCSTASEKQNMQAMSNLVSNVNSRDLERTRAVLVMSNWPCIVHSEQSS
uniref:Uncharacterized protein n=1 Tax=Strigamia maritima TaxID=126957 RepID=T1J1E8_STRMM